MKTTFKFNNPDDMDATLSITMSMKRWKELRAQLSNSYPSWQLSSSITGLIIQAEKAFYVHEDETK